MLDTKNISVVIQGAIDKEDTPRCIASARHFLPGAEIIVSTYIGTDVSHLDYDEVVLVKDPGFYLYSNEKNSKINNINRQITTTVAGLNKATRKYAFKLRSDFSLCGSNFLEFFRKFLKSDKDYQVFEKKILIPVFFSRNPKVQEYSLPFHPSDIACFGLRSDVLNFFDVPLMSKSDENFFKFKKNLYCRYVPEQYLWINCLRKNGKIIKFDHQRDCNPLIIEQTERYAASNFVYLDYMQLGLIPPKRLTLYCQNDFLSTVTHVEWQHLYKKYVDDSYMVSNIDPLRDKINKNTQIVKICTFLVKYTVIFLPYSPLRKKMRLKIIDYLTRKICI